jgi:hypothetical protein
LADFANWFTFTALGTDLLLLESRILNILNFVFGHLGWRLQSKLEAIVPLLDLAIFLLGLGQSCTAAAAASTGCRRDLGLALHDLFGFRS